MMPLVKVQVSADNSFLADVKAWFEDYTAHFLRNTDDTYRQNIQLKIDHTKRVCQEIVDLASHLGLGTQEVAFAESLGLMHDVGRFEQYTRYKTFSDINSLDHATLGVSILKENGVLNQLNPHEQDLFLRCVGYHNRVSVPESETPRCRLFSTLLRDADKLDIWRVVTRYYADSEQPRNPVLELDTVKSSEISDKVAKAIMAYHLVQKEDLQTSTDFKVLQMGWVFDLNFVRSYQLVDKRQYLEKIVGSMPENNCTIEIYRTVRRFLDQRLQEECSIGSHRQ